MNAKFAVLFFIGIAYCLNIFSQTSATNIVIVTLDGMRWQEVFNGADSALLFNKDFTRDLEGTKDRFWDSSNANRRIKLFPFLWNVIAQNGQLYGNRNRSSFVNVSNPYHFSYPGYNEIFTGYPDTAVSSNDKVLNQNKNVLEFINQQKGYEHKVAVFSTWDAFPYILNKWRSKIYINADSDSIMNGNESKLLNDIQRLSSKPIDVRLDVLTYVAAREYVKTKKPKVLCIGFDETDDYAHKGDYEQYLKSAHAEDGMIADLWSCLQSMEEYKNKTTLLITCDHGRGDTIKENWTDHGEDIAESGEIWIAAMGPTIENMGEMKNTGQIYQKQLAVSIGKLVGFNFKSDHNSADLIASFFRPIQNPEPSIAGVLFK
jgi:hypothetical protein